MNVGVSSDKARVIHAHMIAKIWKDPDYRAKVTSDPKAALAEEGIHLSAGTRIHVLEDTDRITHVVLPDEVDAKVQDDLRTTLSRLLPFPEHHEVRLVQNTNTLHYFVIPVVPRGLTATTASQQLGKMLDCSTNENINVNQTVIVNVGVTSNTVVVAALAVIVAT
jgi:hypothetical protein